MSDSLALPHNRFVFSIFFWRHRPALILDARRKLSSCALNNTGDRLHVLESGPGFRWRVCELHLVDRVAEVPEPLSVCPVFD